MPLGAYKHIYINKINNLQDNLQTVFYFIQTNLLRYSEGELFIIFLNADANLLEFS